MSEVPVILKNSKTLAYKSTTLSAAVTEPYSAHKHIYTYTYKQTQPGRWGVSDTDKSPYPVISRNSEARGLNFEPFLSFRHFDIGQISEQS